jgi:sulfite exporter TauE/SafE
MLSSINPLGERARASSWRATTIAYVLGNVGAGALFGALLGALGSVLGGRARGFAGLAAALGLAVLLVLELAGRLPSWRRQVDVGWIGRYRGWVTGLGYGAQLGLGAVTIITSTTTYAALALSLLSGGVWRGAIVMGAFGLLRATPSLLMRTVDTPEGLHRVFARVEAWRIPADRVARVTSAGVVLALGASGWTAVLGGW